MKNLQIRSLIILVLVSFFLIFNSDNNAPLSLPISIQKSKGKVLNSFFALLLSKHYMKMDLYMKI